MAASRYRNFCCVLYPSKKWLDDNGLASDYDGSSGYGILPDDFYDIIESWKIPAFLSPLHDHDIDYDYEGEIKKIKKPHFHLELMFEGPKSIKQAKELFDQVNGVYSDRDIVVNDFRSYSRYLCHLDHPHKYQYNITDVVAFGACCYTEAIESSADAFRILLDIQSFVIDSPEICSYHLLVDWCYEHDPNWFRVLTSRFTLHFVNYFKSRKFDK